MKHRIFALLATAYYVFLFFYFKLFQVLESDADLQEILLELTAALTLLALIVGVWGIVFSKPWGRSFFLAGNVAYLGFGVYITHFVWTFWLIEKPALQERVINTAPYFVSGILLPIILILLALKKRKH